MSARCNAVLLSALLLASSCDQGQPAKNVTQVKMANPESDQLKTMAPLYRNLGLYRAIRDSGQSCKKVDNGAYQQDYKNMAMWVAHCTDTGAWAIFIAPNGDAQVRACGDLRTLGLPACAPIAPAAKSDSTSR
jgi:hypothetical protein